MKISQFSIGIILVIVIAVAFAGCSSTGQSAPATGGAPLGGQETGIPPVGSALYQCGTVGDSTCMAEWCNYFGPNGDKWVAGYIRTTPGNVIHQCGSQDQCSAAFQEASDACVRAKKT